MGIDAMNDDTDCPILTHPKLLSFGSNHYIDKTTSLWISYRVSHFKTLHRGCQGFFYPHYSDVIMGAMASQITSFAIVYSTVYTGADQRKHQSSASLAFVRGIHRGPVNSSHKWLVMRKMFPFDGVIMCIVIAKQQPGDRTSSSGISCYQHQKDWYHWHQNQYMST